MIDIRLGDITQLDVEVIVNAANERLLGGSGVDGAIHAAAGPALLEHCRAIGGCPTGEARITPGFQLRAKWVVHTVGPIWRGGAEGEPELLRNCYQNSFKLAREVRAKTIAFPCISTGVYAYPPDSAVNIALNEMRAFEQDFETIVACCFSDEDVSRYRAAVSYD